MNNKCVFTIIVPSINVNIKNLHNYVSRKTSQSQMLSFILNVAKSFNGALELLQRETKHRDGQNG